MNLKRVVFPVLAVTLHYSVVTLQLGKSLPFL